MQQNLTQNATGVVTSEFAENTDLASLKPDIEKLDIDKLEKVPSGSNNFNSKVHELDVNKLVLVLVDLSKLSDEVKGDVVKKTEYDELVKKFNNIKTIDTSDLIKNLTMIFEIIRK